MPSSRIAICLETSPTQAFASALDWPGWGRAGRDEASALRELDRYVGRYGSVADRAGVSLPSSIALDVVERVASGPTTAFAAPECRRPFPQVSAESDRVGTTPAEDRRRIALLIATWATFDEVAAESPPELRKGPRGGGRNRDELMDHVITADATYARKLGLKLRRPAIGDLAAIEGLREAVVSVLGAPSDGSPLVPSGWTSRYAARRIAWHVLEHAWEMQDRAEG
jgi:hypothetical protein